MGRAILGELLSAPRLRGVSRSAFPPGRVRGPGQGSGSGVRGRRGHSAGSGQAMLPVAPAAELRVSPLTRLLTLPGSAAAGHTGPPPHPLTGGRP